MKLERAIDAVQFLCRIVIEDASGGVSKDTIQEVRTWLGYAIGQPGSELSVSASSFVSPLAGPGGKLDD